MIYSNNIKSILLIFLGCIIIGCEKENSENLIIEELYIEAQLAPYFERFVTEGANRGVVIDLEAKRIEGYLVNIEETGVAGQCSYSPTSSHKVSIDIDYWNSASDLEKEFVIFHELGHCYLERSHLDAQNNRNCTSIMHSGTSGCRFRYNTASRSEYLDELF